MNQWLTERDLLERWNISHDVLTDMVWDGELKAYERGAFLNPIDIPRKSKEQERAETKEFAEHPCFHREKVLCGKGLSEQGDCFLDGAERCPDVIAYYSCHWRWAEDGFLDKNIHNRIEKERFLGPGYSFRKGLMPIPSYHRITENTFPDVPKRISKLISILEDVESYHMIQYAALKALLPVLRFRLADLEAWEVDQGLALQETKSEPADLKKRPEQGDKEKAFEEIENYLHHEGAGWRIGFQGEKGNFMDYKYIRYISLLLGTPGKSIRALELVRAVDGSPSQAECLTKEQALDEDLSLDRISKHEEISTKKVREFEKLLADIEKETDPIVKREMEEEYERKIEPLMKMNVLVDDEGKPAHPSKKQKLDDPHAKKAQSSVKKALANAYSAFKKSGLKKLASHLEKNIRPAGDYDFWYCDTETYWDIKL